MIMSLPTFPDMPDDFTFDKSIYQIISSIAMEELGLSHIINAEGEKIQYVLGTLEGSRHATRPTIEELLEINESVRDTLQQVSFNQMFLNSKMTAALNAYMQNKNDKNNNNDNEEDPDNPKPPPPIVPDPPEVMEGDLITTDLTDDVVDWIPIASYGDYILIVRSQFINIRPDHLGDPAWQYISFGTTNAYRPSKVRSAINSWFNDPNALGDKLPMDARIRLYTMQNTAATVLGTGYSDAGGLENGFSKPTTVQIPSGSDDIAFALSFCESANFISNEYSVNGASIRTDSVTMAQNNFSKLVIPTTEVYGMWLRSPGSTFDKAGSLNLFGTAFQFPLNYMKFDEYGLVYPALWVNSAILTP